VDECEPLPWGNNGQEIPTYVRFILMFWDHLPAGAYTRSLFSST